MLLRTMLRNVLVKRVGLKVAVVTTPGACSCLANPYISLMIVSLVVYLKMLIEYSMRP
jgi:hypothetical protein